MWNWKTKNISIVVEPRRMKRLPKALKYKGPAEEHRRLLHDKRN